MKVEVELRGKGLAAFTAAAKDLASPKAKAAARMALNDTGRQVNTKVKRALVKQSGIKYGVIQKGIRQEFATNAMLEYRIIGTGKHFGLTDFSARQTQRGVSAAPWGKRRIFPRTFFIPSKGNQVYARQGKSRLPVKKLYGPSIPREMVRDEVPKQFALVAQAVLPVQVAKQFKRLMPK